MSHEPKLTKKQKKAAAFRDRKGKGKAKHLEDGPDDIPLQEDENSPALEVSNLW
jgi:nucleolar protein 6